MVIDYYAELSSLVNPANFIKFRPLIHLSQEVLKRTVDYLVKGIVNINDINRLTIINDASVVSLLNEYNVIYALENINSARINTDFLTNFNIESDYNAVMSHYEPHAAKNVFNCSSSISRITLTDYTYYDNDETIQFEFAELVQRVMTRRNINNLNTHFNITASGTVLPDLYPSLIPSESLYFNNLILNTSSYNYIKTLQTDEFSYRDVISTTDRFSKVYISVNEIRASLKRYDNFKLFYHSVLADISSRYYSLAHAEFVDYVVDKIKLFLPTPVDMSKNLCKKFSKENIYILEVLLNILRVAYSSVNDTSAIGKVDSTLNAVSNLNMQFDNLTSFIEETTSDISRLMKVKTIG
jgi:hypothetical protein